MPNFGTFRFGERLFGGGNVAVPMYSADRLVFEGFSLSDGSVMVLNEFPEGGPSREIVGGAIPRGDGEYIVSTHFREKVIQASGIVRKDSAAELAAFLRTIQRNLRTQEGNLDITDDDGTVRRHIATVDNFDGMFAGRRHYHVTFCPWTIRFRCKAAPFGRSREYESAYKSLSTSPDTMAVTHDGTDRARPVFVLVFNSATTVTTVNVKNDTNDVEIEYEDAVAAGDVLEFDSEQQQVRKNGSEVDFVGAFPELEPGDNTLRFTIDGTFSVSATAKWKTAFL